MIFSYNWIQDLVPTLTASPAQLAEKLTLHSFEVEVSREQSIDDKITVVEITKLEPHPNADRLRLAVVSDGTQEITVVCGAPNIAVGQRVPYSPPGTKVKDEKGRDVTVQEATIRDVTSPGMLNSLRELGLHHDHAGIWVLPSDTPVGSALADHLPPDTILDADLTPNRAHDCFSHIGLAREIAALYGLEVSEPEVPAMPKPQADVGGMKVDIGNNRLCSRYLGIVVDNLHIAPSPLWLQARLLAAGGKPINNIVDITNYVTFEYGNPNHLFDRRNIMNSTIGVRAAAAGEHLTTLDQVQRELTPDDMVITADDAPIALAGLMGGGQDEVSHQTASAFLEVANFNAYHVQETARRLNLHTEASQRFSKQLDPNLVPVAAGRIIDLLQQHAGADVTGVLDSAPQPRPRPKVSFTPAAASSISGLSIPDAKAKDALERLRFEVNDAAIPWSITVPTDRLDIEAEHDVTEEVIRLVGLDTIISSDLGRKLTARPLPAVIYWREIIRDALVELGLTETYNYSFEPAKFGGIFGSTTDDHITIANPVSPDLNTMRTSLMPGLLANAAGNREAFQRRAGAAERALFEIGTVFRPSKQGRVPGVTEQLHVAAVIVGGTPTLSDIASGLAARLSVDRLDITNNITKNMADQLKYHLPLSGFELSLEQLIMRAEGSVPPPKSLADIQNVSNESIQFTSIPRYPAAYRDLSVLVDPKVTVEQAQEIIERTGGQLVADVDLFDEYQPAADAPKGLAFHITYQSLDKTLTDDEVAAIHNKIVASLEQELGAKLRQ